MQTSTVIWLISLSGLLLFLGISLYYVRTVQPPQSGNCDEMMLLNPSARWSKNCVYIMETTFDSTLATPKNPLYLANFTESASLGPPLGANVWYRYKYVKESGAYGSFSPWTKSAIIAGSKTLPCKDEECKGVKTGADSCKSNLVRLRVDSLDYDVSQKIFVNIYRLVKPPTDTSPPKDTDKGEVIGVITPGSQSTGQFIDTTESPCKKINCNRPGC